MSVSRGGLDLRVAKQLAYHGKALAKGQGSGSKGVAEIVDAHIMETGFLFDPLSVAGQAGT